MTLLSEEYRSRYMAEYEAERARRGVKWGTCFCGCERETAVADSTDLSSRKLAGHPRWWIRGHANKISGPDYEVQDRGYKTPCWIWRKAGHTSPYGQKYGTLRRPGESVPVSAHRYMWEKHRGAVAPGLDLDHLCRVTLCVNPDHLEPVTHAENVRRGRGTRLTMEDAQEIRRVYAAGGISHRKLAKQRGVSAGLVLGICRGKLWREPTQAISIG